MCSSLKTVKYTFPQIIFWKSDQDLKKNYTFFWRQRSMWLNFQRKQSREWSFIGVGLPWVHINAFLCLIEFFWIPPIFTRKKVILSHTYHGLSRKKTQKLSTAILDPYFLWIIESTLVTLQFYFQGLSPASLLRL